MSIERTYYSDNPDCGDEEHGSVHATTATSPPHLPMGFIEVREVMPNEQVRHHFCGWGCLMMFAAKQPIPEVIEMDDER